MVRRCCVVRERDNCHRMWYFWSKIGTVLVRFNSELEATPSGVYCCDKCAILSSAVVSAPETMSAISPRCSLFWVSKRVRILSPQPGRTRHIHPPLLSRPNDTGLHGRTSPSTSSHKESKLGSRFQACRQDKSSRTISTIVPGASSLSCSTFVWLATACPRTSLAFS